MRANALTYLAFGRLWLPENIPKPRVSQDIGIANSPVVEIVLDGYGRSAH